MTREERIQKIIKIMLNHNYEAWNPIAEDINSWIEDNIMRGWVRTADRLPEEKDADSEGKVPILTVGVFTGSWVRISIHYKAVTSKSAVYFLSFPPLPALPEVDA